MRYVIVVVVAVFSSLCHSLTPQCRDENGEPVDWFYVYKLPRERNHLNPLVRRGVAYMYLTPSKLRNGWTMSELAIKDLKSMVGQTLSPLYQDKNIISLIYNDQPPATEHQPDVLQSVAQRYSQKKKVSARSQASMKKFKKFKLGDKYYDDYDLAEMCKMHSKFMKSRVESGHTKGVLLGDKFSSLWLVHSVPRFPPVPDTQSFNTTTYDYPTTGLKYGQTFLCMSIQTSTVNQIATQLKYNEPLISYYHIPQDIENELPNLVDVVHNKTVDTSPWYHIESFETLVGRKFLSFAKSAMFNDDLYSGLVAEVLQSDLLVESWSNGPGTLDSECTRNFQVRNIERLKFPMAKMSFTSHSDHSKWTVAVAHKMHNSQDTKVADYWVCVGDINRALPQESRGGGTVCTSGPILWGNFAHLIETVQAWYLYKPSSAFVHTNEYDVFSYITTYTTGRFRLSDKSIVNSMLRNSLSPLFTPTYVDNMAVLKYGHRNGSGKGDHGTLMYGILIADALGGVWITHTVPDFPDLSTDRFMFPKEENKRGHMFMCMTVDLATLNQIVPTLMIAEPRLTYTHIPPAVKSLVPDWGVSQERGRGRLITSLSFQTNEKLPVTMMIRAPGESRCLYKKFAREKGIILDVYLHREHNIICEKNYGVRHIDSISLKDFNLVRYISNTTDGAGFAVSTAAHWQRTGSGPKRYLACVHSPDDGLAKAGLIVCAEDYDLWRAFDILKVKEPGC
ncbi:hypothetical protein ACJJTC_006253 [Scirpophaga incertulas]